ncbi:MAG TPA: nucleotide exchange factor GrpE [Chlamydiales bacterium]|nr:nucleotide exchange factor GrpE [Chlamydiales bacterium]
MTEEEQITTPPETPKAEEADWKDKYFRTLAEMENMRKRLQKERQEMVRFGIDNAISEFLMAIDNFENALRFAESAGSEVKNWAVGFEMILSQFKEVLHNHGIVSFHSEGNVFDADLHEAVEIEETMDWPDGTILHEFAKGYKSHLRIIRPARVKVAKHPSKINQNAALQNAAIEEGQ